MYGKLLLIVNIQTAVQHNISQGCTPTQNIDYLGQQAGRLLVQQSLQMRSYQAVTYYLLKFTRILKPNYI